MRVIAFWACCVLLSMGQAVGLQASPPPCEAADSVADRPACHGVVSTGVAEERDVDAAHRQQVLLLLRDGQQAQAKAYASTHDMDFAQLLAHYQRIKQQLLDAQEQQRQWRQSQFRQHRRQRSGQVANLEQRRERLFRQRAQQRDEYERTQSQRSRDYSYPDSRVRLPGRGSPHHRRNPGPHYVPSVGQICEEQRGVISCRR
jgi:hypothetical protein